MKSAGPFALTPQFHQGFDKALEHLQQGQLILRHQRLQPRVQCRHEEAQIAVEHRLDKLLLGAEVIIDRSQVHIGLAGDQTQRGIGEPRSANSTSAASRIRFLVSILLTGHLT
jgi:hypothetical protein